MSTLSTPTDLVAVIQELRHRLLAIQLTDVRITPLGRRLLVDARFHDCQAIGNVRRCCDEISQQTGIPVSLNCTVF